MSAIPNNKYRDGILHGLLIALPLAFIGYALGYVLNLFSLQTLIMYTVSNITSISTIHNVVLGQYSSSIILPYAFAFIFAIVGFAYGLYTELRS